MGMLIARACLKMFFGIVNGMGGGGSCSRVHLLFVNYLAGTLHLKHHERWERFDRCSCLQNAAN